MYKVYLHTAWRSLDGSMHLLISPQQLIHHVRSPHAAHGRTHALNQVQKQQTKYTLVVLTSYERGTEVCTMYKYFVPPARIYVYCDSTLQYTLSSAITDQMRIAVQSGL